MTQSPFGKLNFHDLRVILFHLVIAAIQTYLIGANIEYPAYAPYFQAVAELLRRVII